MSSKKTVYFRYSFGIIKTSLDKGSPLGKYKKLPKGGYQITTNEFGLILDNEQTSLITVKDDQGKTLLTATNAPNTFGLCNSFELNINDEHIGKFQFSEAKWTIPKLSLSVSHVYWPLFKWDNKAEFSGEIDLPIFLSVSLLQKYLLYAEGSERSL